MTKVFIDGSAGTTGLRIYERLGMRDDIELINIEESKRKDIEARKAAIKSADIAFLCLPDAAAVEIAEAVGDCETKIFDTSTAHRTNENWAYGFPELSEELREKVINSKRIAVPGCHASGFNALVYPMTKSGLMPNDYPVVCYSVTGYSGGGKKMIAEYESSQRDTELFSPRQYGLTQKHKHLREMKVISKLSQEPVFSPIVADFYSGMVVTVPIYTNLLTKKVTAEEIYEMFKKHYKGSKAVEVMPFGKEGFLGSNNLSGKDSMEIEITGNDDRVLLASRFDNLGKGSSGAAIQCMNLVMETDEIKGLNI